MKQLLIILLIVITLVGCQQQLFPIDSLNTLTIEQETPLHRKIESINTGNTAEGVSGTIWHHQNATHKDSVAIWGYVMHVHNRYIFRGVIFSTIDLNNEKDPVEVQSVNQDSGIIHIRIKPGLYDLVAYPSSPRASSFVFNKLDLKGGDSVAFIVVAPESNGYKYNGDNTEWNNFNHKLNKQKWYQRLFKPRYLQYYVNGKKVKQKITNNKPVKVKKKKRD